jgi:DNA-binding response OmpR family regulator
MRSALVIDSDPSTERMVARQLERVGFVAITALRYEDVVRALSEHRPRLVCLSLSLPSCSGYDVCEAIRADHRLGYVQILVMSDRATPQEMAWAEEAGANAFLRKPFTARELEIYVHALIDPRRASRPGVRRLRRADAAFLTSLVGTSGGPPTR